MPTDIVPTVDLRDPAESVAVSIDRACHDIGFFQIVGHGLDPVIEQHVWEAATAFFALPIGAKQTVAIRQDEAGFRS